MYYEGESRTWGIAARIVAERVRSLPHFGTARAAIVKAAVELCRGKCVADMRLLGGFSGVLERLVGELPQECHANVGSKLLPSSVAAELRGEIPAMRSEVQRTLANEKENPRAIVDSDTARARLADRAPELHQLITDGAGDTGSIPVRAGSSGTPEVTVGAIPTPGAYIVRYGSYHRCQADFGTFPEALAFYREHESDEPEGASLYGAEYDSEHDGLTQEQRDEVVG